MIKKIDHIAIAVDNMEEEIKKYRDILGLELTGREVVEGQHVEVAFFRAGDVNIELTAPTREDSPVGKFLKKRGPGIHHLAFEVEDINNGIAQLRDKGVRMIHNEAQEGAEGARVAFVHPTSFPGVLMEIKEKKKG